MSYATPSSDPLAGSTPSNAVQQLMQQRGGMLFGLGRRFCGNEDEAAGLVQETMLEAFKGWPSFRGCAKATTWLYRIAASTCQRMHHKKGPEAGELPSDDITGLNDTTIRVRVHRVRLALRKAIENGLGPPASTDRYEAQICKDLIDAKQEAMDRGADFDVPPDVLTDWCRAVFNSLEFTKDLCTSTTHRLLPEDISERIIVAINQSQDS
jgi:hypothetical protein